MITNFYTLRALATEWAPELTGSTVGDVFSQERDELTLALAQPEREWMLRVSVQAPLRFIFRNEGYSRARRNVATLLEDAFDRSVVGVRIASRDRIIFIDLDGGLYLQIVLFGSRPNVFLVGPDGVVLDAFQAGADWAGQPAPTPRPAPEVDSLDAFEARWKSGRKTSQAVAAAMPLLDRQLAAEVMARADVTKEQASDCNASERSRLFKAAVELEADLQRPSPRIFWRGPIAESFSLVALRQASGLREERFETVDSAVRVFVRRSLAQQRFAEAYVPLERALAEAARRNRDRVDRMLEELARESRADRYERWAHLLMATPGELPAGASEVVLPDLFADEDAPGAVIAIPLEPALNRIENAQSYYDRARRTRRSREEAENRLDEVERHARDAEELLNDLRTATSYADVDTFRKREADRLARYTSGISPVEDRIPFRRFALPDGYEVWVGRNARQNEQLTFRHARKYDLWMHARGVAGSHAVLRLPNRQAQPARHILHLAASIAAYFSKAQGSSLVPVMVAERKFVRKPKGAVTGAVVVEREDVLLVEPRLPS
jgi:predicted ribosome quality control (RQC) complex YloA/Tae2 family protein